MSATKVTNCQVEVSVKVTQEKAYETQRLVATSKTVGGPMTLEEARRDALTALADLRSEVQDRFTTLIAARDAKVDEAKAENPSREVEIPF